MIGYELLARSVSIEHVVRNGGLYYIINCEHGAYLKLAADADDVGDRQAFVHAGDFPDPARYSWLVTHSEKGLNFQNNSHTGGLLFVGADTDHDGDYTIYGEPFAHDDRAERRIFNLWPKPLMVGVERANWQYYIQIPGKWLIHQLKAGWKDDGEGDYGVYAGRENAELGHRDLWIFVPVD